MDYEKAYKESFEAAKGLHDAGNALTKKQMEIVFHQLAESKDERIRKELVAFFIEVRNREGNEGYWHDLKVADILTYLEKQKEQKLNSVTKHVHNRDEKQFIRDCANILRANDYAASADRLESMFEQKPDEVDKSTKRMNENWMKQYFNDYKEQKPAEWILPEEFEEAVYKVANFISPFDSQEELRKVSHRFAEQLLSLAKKELDKPAEWSEEDEIMIGSLINYFEGDALDCSTEDVVNWLKSLHPQPKQEWSVEDELMIKCCSRAIEHYKYTGKPNVFCPSQFNVDGYLTSPEKVQTWLKSLRNRPKPSDNWKPSEEQMNALYDVIHPCDHVYKEQLESLYEQLQRL